MADEADDLDGCSVDLKADAVSDADLPYVALFPDGVADEAKAAEWRAVLGG